MGLARVGISLTTLDRGLARSMEPRAAAPERRLAMIGALAAAGCPVRVMVAPVIPGLTDHEIERLLAAAAEAGAVAAGCIALRLPLEVAGLFAEWLERTHPDRARKVMAAVREMHGGRDYDPTWGRRMTGAGVRADMIQRRFAAARARLGLARDLPPLRTDLFRARGAAPRQLALF
jgi:DNA repair photolyase